MGFQFAVVLFAIVGLSSQRSTPSNDHYVAAVVEYYFEIGSSIDAIRENHETVIRQAAEQDVDIVVFPEQSLANSNTSFSVPIHGLLQEFPVPALHPNLYDDLLVAMSAAARDNEIYVVINTRERMDCTQPQQGEDCPEEKVYVFNTNVVFNREGAVIDRYRKINLFGEATHTPALKPDLGIFTTDFNVTFGHFIGFDLLFQVPAIQTVQKHNIKNIIFPTFMTSEVPYLTAIQVQESFAYTMDVNFLGAGVNHFFIGRTGSGIYSGKAGALVSFFNLSATRLLVAKVPKVPGNVEENYPGPIYAGPYDFPFFHPNLDLSLRAHLTRPLVEGYQDFTIVDRDISCRFQARLRNRTSLIRYHYRAAAFGGVRSFSGVRTGGVRACSIYICVDSSKLFCGRRTPNVVNGTAIFEELTITGTMPTPVIVPELDADDSVIFPVSLTLPYMPLEAKDFTYNKNVTGDVTVHTMTLKNSDPELFTFGLWGRVFGTDGQNADPPADDPPIEDPNGLGWVHGLSNGLLVMLLAVHIYNQYL